MPVVCHRLRDRRAFLKTAALSGAAMVVSGFRGGAPSDPSRRELHLALL